MRTIGRHVPGNISARDFVTHCSYCGVPYYRSQMKRDRAGLLACPNDARGGDVVSLSEENAAQAQRSLVDVDPIDGGAYDLGPTNVPPPPEVYRPS